MENELILILKLADGTEIIATTNQQEESGAYICRDILTIMVTVDESGRGQMGLMEFMPYADKKAGFAIPHSMASITLPSEQLLNHYKERFSKIILPDSKIKL